MKKSLGLGKGLGALIPRGILSVDDQTTLTHDDGTITNAIALIEITRVRPNRYQPRQDFDTSSLDELTRSIKQKGVIQPITVRRVENGYELIAGERRVRASIEAGLTTIPAYIVEVERETDMLELALIENVQRENLNPIEVALGYKRLIEECHMTQEEVASKVGKDRSTITNFLRLLKLTEPVQEALRIRKISMGHARALLAINDPEMQKHALEDILSKDLSVRATEALVRTLERRQLPNEHDSHSTQQIQVVGTSQIQSTLSDIEAQLRSIFATNVRVKIKTSSRTGTIEIDFYSLEDLERLLELMVVIERALQR